MSRAQQQIESLNASMRIVVLHGREPFLQSEATHRLAELLAAEHGDAARFSIDGETATLSDVLDELRSYALFEPHKLVIVDAADRFLAGDARRRPMEAYAAQPAEHATLLMRAETWRPGKFDKLVAAVGTVIKCEPLKDREAVAWCRDNAQARHGAAIERQAAELLVQRLGPGLSRLDSELAKLVAFSGGSRSITRADVGELVGRSREEQAWALQTAIMSGTPATAVAKLRELLDVSRLDTTLVMWAISDLLRRVHAAAQLLRQGASGQDLRRTLKLWGPTGERVVEVARSTEPRRIAQLLHEAVETDVRSKRGLGDAQRNLEALTLRVTDTIGCV